MGWQPESLTPQIDGVKQSFTTTFQRVVTQLMLFHNGTRVPDASFSEPNASTIATSFVPVPGDELFVFYFTDQTVDGRVQGFTEDPGGLPPEPPALEEVLEDLDNRIDALETGGALPALSGNDGAVLTEVQPGGTLAFLPIPSGSASFRSADFVPTAGQTVFNLPSNIGDPDSVLFKVNDLVYNKDIDYSVTGLSQVTWLNSEFSLDAIDEVEIAYLEG